MATAAFGNLQEFKLESESIAAYLERTTVYFDANSIAAEKQVSVLLSVVGAQTYSLLRSLTAPELPSAKSLAQLTALFKAHFEPTPLVIAERFHFHRRNQAPGESIAAYVAELRRFSTHCAFDATLDDALRDRLVCGLRQESIQKRLLSEANLTLARAMELAQGMEAADKNTRALRGTEAAIKYVTPSENSSQRRKCYRCARTGHEAKNCRFATATCLACGKKGHIAPACRSKTDKRQPRIPPRQVKCLTEGDAQANSDTDDFYLLNVGSKSSRPITVDVLVNGKQLTMDLDTGASVSIISEAKGKELFPGTAIKKSRVTLKTYTDESIRVLGELPVTVRYQGQEEQLVLFVVEGMGPSLLGRNWLSRLKIDWKSVHAIASPDTVTLDNLLDEHKDLFKDGLGTIEPFTAKLNVQKDARPRFFRPRSIPFAIKPAIEQELDALEASGAITKVPYSEWAAPIVPVPKKDGKFRICGDYKVTVNQALEVDQYPLPKPEHLFATLAGGKKFTKLDLSQAYQQLRLDEDSVKYTTVNTHRGLYQYTRLPFGIASAPALFQQLMDNILQGIPNVICYIDDILITGVDDAEHLNNLQSVFQRLQKHGFRLKKSKCEFLKSSVEFLGHRIDAEGLHTLPSKLQAIVDAPEPRNLPELRSFLGLLNYYGKFVSNLAMLLQPLNRLLQADQKWAWTDDCSKAFQGAKAALSSSHVLTHYDPALPVTLAGDASAYGIGAVISHTFPDGTERPIAFASRTLNTSEKNYAQIEKEALSSLIFGVKKFHQYLYGRHFTLVTDHKPLLAILGEKKGIPSLAAARLQRWAVLLAAYQYTIKFKSTKEHANADGLSRLPLSDKVELKDQSSPGPSIFNIAQLDA